MMRSLTFLLIAGFVLVMAGEADADEETEYENPEIVLKFNLKEENDALSPQNKLPGEPEATKTVQADYDYSLPGMKTGRNPVHVGTWTSDPVEFDVNISVKSFDVWWEDLEEGDDSCEWTITIQVNDQDVSEDTSDCQHDGDPLAKGTHDLNTNIDLAAGDTIGIDLVFEGWDDIKIHYDNVTYDTGLNVKGNHLMLFDNKWENTIVTMEFAEAWPTDWNTNLDAEYIMVAGDDEYMADNAKASVRDGNEHTFQGNSSTMEVTSTVIEWTGITGTGLRIMVDYTVFGSKANGTNGTYYDAPLLNIILEKTEPGVHIETPAAIIDFISSDNHYGLINLTENYDSTTTITTYLEGKKTGYTSNGNYGDVITFYKNGLTTYEGNSIIPTTSRVMAWVEVIDKENGTYYIPEIDTYFYGKIELSEIGLPPDAPLTGLTQSGYLTKVDSISSNPHPDQLTHTDITGSRAQPVQPEWIIGIKTQQFDCRMETGSNVIFEGHGLGSLTITDYLWESSIDGELSTNASFSTNSLSMGNHIISFTVRDDSGLWSSPASASLMIVFKILKADDDGRDDGFLPAPSLAAAGAAVAVIALRRRY